MRKIKNFSLIIAALFALLISVQVEAATPYPTVTPVKTRRAATATAAAATATAAARATVTPAPVATKAVPQVNAPSPYNVEAKALALRLKEESGWVQSSAQDMPANPNIRMTSEYLADYTNPNADFENDDTFFIQTVIAVFTDPNAAHQGVLVANGTMVGYKNMGLTSSAVDEAIFYQKSTTVGDGVYVTIASTMRKGNVICTVFATMSAAKSSVIPVASLAGAIFGTLVEVTK